MNKAAIYIRVSSRMQEDGFSMEAQHDILMDLIDKKSLQLYKVYSDPAVSGKTFKRPGVQMMIQDMKDGKFDTILIHKLDRLSRNQGDLYGFIQQINKLDVRLIIAAQGSEEIDTRSPMGKAFLMFSGIWAEIYLDNLREETLKGLTKKAQKGGRHMSRPPLGYDFDADMNLVVVEEEAELVRKIYQMFLSGMGRNKIAIELNKTTTGKRGGVWDSFKIKSIIQNPRYIGMNHFKPAAWSDDKRIIREGEHDAIISVEDHEKAMKMLKRRSNSEMSKTSYLYAYSGILKCARCGGNFNGSSTTVKRNYGEAKYKNYKCHKNYHLRICDMPSISEPILTELVFNKIIFEAGTIEEKKVKKQAQVDLKKEVEISNRRKRNWMLALGDGNLSSSDYAALVEEEEERMNTLFDKAQVEEFYKQEISADELFRMVQELRTNWEYLNADTQKEVIQSMFRSITIDKIDNNWKILEIKIV
ncbi:recombinase family protein [Paenibacillus sp. NEAU-GSW1]|uniref:recombinase family protein n=1 Tax=Paenibacillus sp. NEAU-GSW1 TaxID=2682486 RepID=UPI0012E0CE2E|nr:recombinase family protein [Paenibacillus sp. NEAU-GSW1]MUT66060.1 hypothetical protein [Paenibacillus sp. NEAU-GSW1]